MDDFWMGTKTNFSGVEAVLSHRMARNLTPKYDLIACTMLLWECILDLLKVWTFHDSHYSFSFLTLEMTALKVSAWFEE